MNSPRHRRARRDGLTTTITRAAAKGLSCLALVGATVAYASLPGVSAASGVSPELAATALIQNRGNAIDVSRSAARTAPAVTAPAAGPTARSVGVLGVTAKAKPKPKPKPVPTATASTTSPAASPAATPAYSAGAYDGAGYGLGLSPSAVRVYSAVRSAFGITNIGGMRPGDWGDHGTGHALDIMIGSFGQGDAVAAFVLANAGAFNVTYVIWRQRIAYPGGGWSYMEDRGSPTQNHMDHVHVSVN